MRLCKFISFAVSLCLFSGFLSAQNIQKDLQIVVKMVGIKVKKTADKSVDELFFNIRQYSNLKSKREGRIPAYPKHWLSKQLPSLKNVILWKGKIAQGESLKLVFSLMEQDSPPWDPDDAIGAVEVNLLNQSGRLKSQWTVPKFGKNIEIVEIVKRTVHPQYIFRGANSRYNVAFSVEQK